MNKFNKTPPTENDYIIFCDICRNKCWFSQSYELEPETGKGGLIVCPRDRDAIDYGLIPYTINPEESPEIIRINSSATEVPNQAVLPPDQLNPWGGGPLAPSDTIKWETIFTNWENITTKWENLG